MFACKRTRKTRHPNTYCAPEILQGGRFWAAVQVVAGPRLCVSARVLRDKVSLRRPLTGVFAFIFALATRCALRALDRHGNNGRANQGDSKDEHGKCQNQGTQVDQPDRTIRVLGSR